MSAAELAAVLASVAALVIAVTLIIAVNALITTLREARETMKQVRSEAVPLLVDLRATVRQADESLDRMDSVLHSAETISKTVGTASSVAATAFGGPVVKVVAAGSGIARAASRMRKKS